MTQNLSPYPLTPLRLSQELFQLAENETCSEVIRADWPTRENDDHCSQKALAVCCAPGCEAPLCVVHAEQCPKCGLDFCAGCFTIHEAACK